jgi:hypothetical protein
MTYAHFSPKGMRLSHPYSLCPAKFGGPFPQSKKEQDEEKERRSEEIKNRYLRFSLSSSL